MVKLDYSQILNYDETKFWNNLTNFKELPKNLPRQLQKIEILEENDNETILEIIIFVRSIIKKEFAIKLKVLKKSEKEIFLEVLDGFAKGTKSTVSTSLQENKIICQINTEIKFNLKTMILIPIVKKEYEGILIKFFRNMEKGIVE